MVKIVELDGLGRDDISGFGKFGSDAAHRGLEGGDTGSNSGEGILGVL